MKSKRNMVTCRCAHTARECDACRECEYGAPPIPAHRTAMCAWCGCDTVSVRRRCIKCNERAAVCAVCERCERCAFYAARCVARCDAPVWCGGGDVAVSDVVVI